MLKRHLAAKNHARVPAPPKTPLRLPKTPPRLSKSLQDGSVSLQELSRRGFLRAQAVSKSSLEELPKPPTFALPPLASGLQVASAGSAKRKFAVPSGVLDPGRFASYLVNILSSSNLRFLGPKILDLRCI